jgi:hypothetical protein
MTVNRTSNFCSSNIGLGRCEIELLEAVLEENIPDFIVFYSGGGLKNEEENGFGFVGTQMEKAIEKAEDQIRILSEFKENASKWMESKRNVKLKLNEESARMRIWKDMLTLFQEMNTDWSLEGVSMVGGAEMLPKLNKKMFREVVQIKDEGLEFHKVTRRNISFVVQTIGELHKEEQPVIMRRCCNNLRSTPQWLAIPKHVDMSVGFANVFSNGREKHNRKRDQYDTWKYEEDSWVRSEISIINRKYLYGKRIK